MKNIQYGSHKTELSDLVFIKKALKSSNITQGKYVIDFENRVKNYLRCKYTLSCNSGTAAIHLAFSALEINKNSIIVMPIINFISSYRVAKLLKAKVFFADVDPITGQMTPNDVEDCIRINKLNKVDLLVTMYLGGDPDNCYDFYKLKKKYKFKILEDACHAFGAEYKHKNKIIKIGSCTHSDIAIFSFHAIKTITTGEGGMLSTNNKNFFLKAKISRSHGILRKKNSHWKYLISDFGMNYRLSDLNCALGISQLIKVKKFLNKRKKIHDFYCKKIIQYKDFCKIRPKISSNKSANHLLILLFNLNNFKIKKEFIFNYFKKNNIYLQYHYPIIKNFKVCDEKHKINYHGALQFYNSSISFPIHPNLRNKELNKIFSVLDKFIIKYKK